MKEFLESFNLVAGLIGGLAMFLYGMNVMSGGLTKAAGGRLESVLAKVTKHPIIAYLFGVGVTALVQSSSASTVMVVGLVNSGIVTLKQAVNVILGANLGTTFTAWILTLNSIESSKYLSLLLQIYCIGSRQKKPHINCRLLRSATSASHIHHM